METRNVGLACLCIKKLLTHTGIGGDAMIVAHDVTLQLTCTGETFQPTWFVNGTVVVTAGHCYTPITPFVDGNELIYTLQIDGNRTCGAMNIFCKAFRRGQLLIIHNISLTFQGKLHCLANLSNVGVNTWCLKT